MMSLPLGKRVFAGGGQTSDNLLLISTQLRPGFQAVIEAARTLVFFIHAHAQKYRKLPVFVLGPSDEAQTNRST
jgi:hypothetical protein